MGKMRELLGDGDSVYFGYDFGVDFGKLARERFGLLVDFFGLYSEAFGFGFLRFEFSERLLAFLHGLRELVRRGSDFGFFHGLRDGVLAFVSEDEERDDYQAEDDREFEVFPEGTFFGFGDFGVHMGKIRFGFPYRTHCQGFL